MKKEDAMNVLVIEPDTNVLHLLRKALSADGWQVSEAHSLEVAMSLENRSWALVFCSANASIDTSYTSIISRLRKLVGNESHIVILGSNESHLTPLKAFLSGATDYIRKPIREAEIVTYARSIKRRLESTHEEATDSPLIISPSFENQSSQLELVGSSEQILRVLKQLAQSLEKRDVNVTRAPSFLITGETGTGKELVARLIHMHSNYCDGEFVEINCSTLPKELAESELFGHESGAFTGATKVKKGLWEVANGGTLFLDEITEAPRELQPKLLRVLQEGRIKRVGANSSIPVDVQVIAASNRELKAEIATGNFRADLYHRLSLYELQLPPLRERREDIPLLIAHFAQRYVTRPIQISHEALKLLERYPWPGNVRELENVIRAAINRTIDGKILLEDVALYLGTVKENLTTNYDEPSVKSLNEKVRKFKLKAIQETLTQHQGNVTRAAAELGITRPTLYKLLKELNYENRL